MTDSYQVPLTSSVRSSHIEKLKSSRVFLIRITFDQISLLDDADISSNIHCNHQQYSPTVLVFIHDLNQNFMLNYCLKARKILTEWIVFLARPSIKYKIVFWYETFSCVVNGKWKRRFWSRLLNSGHSLHLSAFLSLHTKSTKIQPVQCPNTALVYPSCQLVFLHNTILSCDIMKTILYLLCWVGGL